jgi:hypothetical protein
MPIDNGIEEIHSMRKSKIFALQNPRFCKHFRTQKSKIVWKLSKFILNFEDTKIENFGSIK